MNKKYFFPLLIIVVLLLVIVVTIKKLNLYPSITAIVLNQSASGSGLQFVADVPLNSGANRLDYQSIDDKTNRLYISHLGSNTVHVFDLGKQKIIADIPLPS